MGLAEDNVGKREQQLEAMKEELLPQMDALFRFSLYLTRDKVEAEELVQETMLKAVKAFQSYQTGTNCKAWLFRIATNTRLNKLRRKDKRVELREHLLPSVNEGEDLASVVRASRTPEESFVTQLSRSKVREAVEKLPSEFRSVVVLADLEGLSYREIAEVLACPIGTVMSRLHRGRKLLRTLLLGWARELGLVEGSGAAAESTERTEDDLTNVTSISAYRERSGDAKGE